MTISKGESNDNVSAVRWQTAQTWELNHWRRDQRELAKFGKNHVWRLLASVGAVPKYRGDDRNVWWQTAFDHYRVLPGTVDKAIEIGCGPYTNMRIIRETCRPKDLVLSDPLVHHYAKFSMTFVREMSRHGGCVLDNHPVEELPFPQEHFDLVVMINVLDHVRDARLAMLNVLGITRPGGYVIIGQDLTDLSDLSRQPAGLKTGHPITVDRDWFEQYFSQGLERVYEKLVPRAEGWAPDWHYGTLAYIGRKTSLPQV